MMSEKNIPYVDSEIGKLEEVIIHTPGEEIEVMTPQTAEKLLYNDILPLSVVEKEHSVLKNFLKIISNVIDVRDVLCKIAGNKDARKAIISGIEGGTSLPSRLDELEDIESDEFCRILIEGLKSRKSTLSSFLSEEEFDYFPLPNLYFTRDSAMVFRNLGIAGTMAYRVRKSESLLMKTIFSTYYKLPEEKILFSNSSSMDEKVSIEGGDFLVFNRNTLIIGLSERTSPDAVDILIKMLHQNINEDLTIYCVLLPKKRATIHLDMVFNIINRNEVLVYEPYICGVNKLRFIKITSGCSGERKIEEIDSLLKDLEKSGYRMNPVFCGGEDPIRQQREQWMSGNNFFAFEPGKIIGYDCNSATLKSLEKEGYSVKPAEIFINRSDSPDNYEKLAVTIPGTELARGGGGVRCMTMPVKRAELDKMG